MRNSLVRCLLWFQMVCYGVATISRLLKMIGLFCKRDLSKRRYSAKETYTLKEPTNRSHPISRFDTFCLETFCRISSLLQGSFAKETYHFKEPTNRSHPISIFDAPLKIQMHAQTHTHTNKHTHTHVYVHTHKLHTFFLYILFVWQRIAEYRLFYRALLQKRPIILRSLLIVATP